MTKSRKILLLAIAALVGCALMVAVQYVPGETWVAWPLAGMFVILLGVFELMTVPSVIQVFAAVGLFAGILVRSA